MTFNPNIPQPNDLISDSQAQLQTNFSQSNSIFNFDHVTFDDATSINRGKHRHSTYIEQLVDPTTLANEMAVYSKDVGGLSRLFYRNESNGSVIPLTGFDPTSGGNGRVFLPGGIIMMWGQFSPVTNAGGFFAFPIPFPNNIFTAILQAGSVRFTLATSALATTGINIGKDPVPGSLSVNYIAIGN